jgi:hypothetical protein
MHVEHLANQANANPEAALVQKRPLFKGGPWGGKPANISGHAKRAVANCGGLFLLVDFLIDFNRELPSAWAANIALHSGEVAGSRDRGGQRHDDAATWAAWRVFLGHRISPARAMTNF